MKVVISGYYGHGNTGDEAILFAVAEQLKGHDLIVVSLAPDYTRRVQGLDAIDFFNMDEIEDAIRKSDMVIMGGGGLFQEFPDIDYYETKVSQFLGNPYGKPDGKLTAFAVVPLTAAVYKKPLIFLAHGIGPFTSDESKAFYGFILSHSSLITVRDSYSLSWANRICKGKKVHLAADPAFLLRPKNGEKAQDLLQRYGLTEKGFITLSLRNLLYGNLTQNAVEEVAQALNGFLTETDLKVLFVPFQNIEVGSYPTQDKAVALRLIDKLDGPLQERIIIAEDGMHPGETLALMDKALFGIGMRYHFLIFSIMNTVPVISISYSEKCTSLMKEIGLGELSFDIHDLDHKQLIAKLHKMLHEVDEYQRTLVSALPDMKRRASYAFALLQDMDGAESCSNDDRISTDAEIDEFYEMRNLLSYKDAHIKDLKDKLNSQVSEKNRTIEELSLRISDREKAIEELNSKISDSERKIGELESEAVERERFAEESNKIISDVRYRLDSILSSKTWRLGQFYGKYLYHTGINKIMERFIDRVIGTTDHLSAADRTASEGKTIAKLQEIIGLINGREKSGVVIVTSAFEFDELYNQRVINLSKHMAGKNFQVIYAAWRWSKEYKVRGLYEEISSNIFQVPVDDFFDYYRLFAQLLHGKRYFVIEFPHPQFFAPMLHLKDAGFMTLYDIIDEWEEFHAVDQAPWFEKDYEDAFVINADVVTAVSQPLIEKFSHIRNDISLIPNGFSSPFLGENANISRRVDEQKDNIDIGYFGHLTDSWFDWELVFKTADQNNDFVFHIIGYGESEKIQSRISAHKNIICYGKVHPSELHRYAEKWDVAMLPFKNNNLSRSVDPIKVYEYLYFGLPAIVQGIDHLNRLPYVHNCAGPDEFRDSIRNFAGMKRNGSVSYGKIAEFLKEALWDKRFDSMLTLLERG